MTVDGSNGIETSQWLSRMGGRVAPVQSSDTLINREDPKGGEIIQGVLEEEGIDVRVGRKVEEVRQEGNGAIAVLATATIELPTALARPVTYEKDPRGSFGLVADQKGRVLVSAWALASLAGEWIHQACWAIRTRTPIDTLLDGIYQFPIFSQVYLEALEKLDL